jgi:hypothetical protein
MARHRRRSPETIIQRTVFEHLRVRGAPGVFAFAVPNGGYRKPIEAAILKGMGVVAGVPDVVIIHAGRCYALELKAEGGRPTQIQLATIAAMKAAGALCAIAVGLDAALAVLEGWGLLRGRRVNAPPITELRRICGKGEGWPPVRRPEPKRTDHENL